ncbi:Endonuclease/exonuclease/phosphatase [Limtongia smithiae]|uniref:Endonuclease/exonuclease/phosphatase n=1 Tax=Limtongia smithiae TaxID=1125753 RepID=UPI0034CE8049
MVSSNWQQQIQLAQISRQSGSPHHHARAAASLSRSSGALGGVLPGGIASLDIASKLGGFLSSPPPASAKMQHRMDDVGAGDIGARSLATREQKDRRQDWAALDLGGQGLRNISPNLFNYNFLDKLYLNHNRLTTLPVAIGNLGQLQYLDISGNLLTSLPTEIGMLKSLRTLLMFDNGIQSLPSEMGFLYKLEVLGIEGNPLPEAVKSLMSRDGTRGVITELRDNSPMPSAPQPRDWVVLDERESEKGAEDGVFTILSYNILCQWYTGVYGYTPSWAIAWDYRKENIRQEIESYDADILCLQEVDTQTYEEFFQPMLEKDYESHHWLKTRAKTMGDRERRKVDGCAIFFKKSVFRLLDKHSVEFNQLALQMLCPKESMSKYPDIYNRVATRDNIAVVCFLEHIKTGNRLMVTDAHIHWDQFDRDVKLVQVGLMLEELKLLAQKWVKTSPTPAADGKSKSGSVSRLYKSITQLPIIICGDYNSTPDSGVSQLVTQGSVPPDHEDFQEFKYGKFSDAGISHPFTLKSSYANIGELAFTNCTPTFTDVIDYIWYSTNNLHVTALIGDVDKEYMTRVIGFPNVHFPSDHVSLLAQLQFKT